MTFRPHRPFFDEGVIVTSGDRNQDAEAPISAAARAEAGAAQQRPDQDRDVDGDGGQRWDGPPLENDGD